MLLIKILLGKQGKWQILFASTGFWIGLFILLLSTHLFLQLRTFLGEKETEASKSYLIINKPVNLLNTFDPSRSGFSLDEIAHIDSQAFILSVGSFSRNTFDVEAKFEMQFGFSTEIFFESLPDQFIDTIPEDFVWDEKKNLIPVILPTEFLNLYNFGFALSQGLPQLPPEAIQMVPFDVIIKGNKQSQKLRAKVVGFTDRLTTVLVPLEFLDWANGKYGKGEKRPNRVIVEIEDPGDERLKSFLLENNYVANQEKMKSRNAGKVLKIVLSVTTGIGLLFVALSFIIFIINFQLIVSRAKYEIGVLINLGYSKRTITAVMNLELFVILAVVVLTVYGVLYYSLTKTSEFLADSGVVISPEFSWVQWSIGGAAIAIMLLLNNITLRFSID